MISPDNQSTYASTAGAVFALDLNVTKKGQQAIDTGGQESRIAIDANGALVALGTFGNTAVYTAPNLEQRLWITKMDNGSGPTTVLFNGMALYVADSGFIWQMDALHGGSPVHTVEVGPEAGYKEARLVLDEAKQRLYVGINGYAGSYSAINLDRQYLISLPESGYSVTDVVSDGNSGIFANNARVSVVNGNGRVAARNDLDGYGNRNTNLALLGNDRVIASPDGYVVGLLMLEKP